VQGNVVKSLAMEKEVFTCSRDTNGDGRLDRVVQVRDVETFIEVVENEINGKFIRVDLGIQVATCTKDFLKGTVTCSASQQDREIARNVSSGGPPPVDLTRCQPHLDPALQPRDPVEMATAFVQKLAKTMKVEKEVLDCAGNVVDMYLFTEIFEQRVPLPGANQSTMRPFSHDFLGIVCVKRNPPNELGSINTNSCFQFRPGVPTTPAR
jgi:hypothetical protein